MSTTGSEAESLAIVSPAKGLTFKDEDRAMLFRTYFSISWIWDDTSPENICLDGGDAQLAAVCSGNDARDVKEAAKFDERTIVTDTEKMSTRLQCYTISRQFMDLLRCWLKFAPSPAAQRAHRLDAAPRCRPTVHHARRARLQLCWRSREPIAVPPRAHFASRTTHRRM